MDIFLSLLLASSRLTWGTYIYAHILDGWLGRNKSNHNSSTRWMECGTEISYWLAILINCIALVACTPPTKWKEIVRAKWIFGKPVPTRIAHQTHIHTVKYMYVWFFTIYVSFLHQNRCQVSRTKTKRPHYVLLPTPNTFYFEHRNIPVRNGGNNSSPNKHFTRKDHKHANFKVSIHHWLAF